MQVANASTNMILSSIQDHGNSCLLQTSSVPKDTFREEMKTVIITLYPPQLVSSFEASKKKLKNVFCCLVELLRKHVVYNPRELTCREHYIEKQIHLEK